MPMYEDHYDGGDGWVPGVDFDPSDADEMEIMRLVWEKEKYDARERLERENRLLRETVSALERKIAQYEGGPGGLEPEVGVCEECEKSTVGHRYCGSLLCGSCLNEVRREAQMADADRDYVFGDGE